MGTTNSTADGAGEVQTVLYVEDHPVNVLLMEALFSKRSNAMLHVATTGMQAWRMSANLRPALLLLDLRLPDCHGAPLLKLLRQRPGWKEVRAIAVTAEYEFELEGTGFLEVWSKPLNLPAVMSRLDQLLQPGNAGATSAAVTGSEGQHRRMPPPDRVQRSFAARLPSLRSFGFGA